MINNPSGEMEDTVKKTKRNMKKEKKDFQKSDTSPSF